jgi:hypothetical protein
MPGPSGIFPASIGQAAAWECRRFFASRLPEYAADPARMDAGGLRRPWRRGNKKTRWSNPTSFFQCPGQGPIRENGYKWLNFMLFHKYLYYSILEFKRVDIDLSCFRHFS